MTMALFMLSCGGNNAATENETASKPRPSGEQITVGIIGIDPNESGYRVACDKDMQSTFSKENGYDAAFAYSLVNDEQVLYARQFIADGVDYLLISAADTSGWDEILRDAKAAGIKVFLFGSLLDCDEELYEAGVVSDMAEEGKTAVNWLKEQNLSEYRILHLQGVTGSAAQVGRSEALEETAETEGWKMVAEESAEWNADLARQVVEHAILADQKFNVIYAEDDTMAQGAAEALDSAGISHGVNGDVIIMGFNAETWALEELLAGNWNYVGQHSPFYAAKIDEMIRTIESGGTIAAKKVVLDEIGFDAKTITREDIDKYGI